MKDRVLKSARQLAGLTQQELGRSCGISQSSVSNLDRGYLRPSPELKRKLARALMVPVDVLFPDPEIEGD